jgi:hypothetical protein
VADASLIQWNGLGHLQRMKQKDRHAIATAKIAADAELAKQQYASDAGSSAAIGTGIVSLLTGGQLAIWAIRMIGIK